MTYQTALAAAKIANADATILIDGIPILFGTRSGLVLNTSGVFVGSGPATLTSIAAFKRESLGIEGSAIDYNMMMVPPSSASANFAFNPLYNKFFERRRAPRAIVTADFNHSATSFGVSSTAGFAVNDVIHVDRESMLVNTLTATDFTSVTRNYCALPGSKPAKHWTLSEVTRQPQILDGRMAVMHLWLNGELNVLFRRLRLSGSPKHDPRQAAWLLDFDDVMSLFDRPIAVGFKGEQVTHVTLVPGTNDLRLVLANALNREFASNPNVESSLAIGGGTGPGVVAEITAVAGTTVDVRNTPTYLALDNTVLGYYQMSELDGISVRRVYVFRGSPMRALLQVLLSDKGDGNNHATHDVLFGITGTGTSGTRELAAGDTECRFGAAIPAALIDIATLESFLIEQPAGWHYVLGSEGEENLLQLIEEVGHACSVFFFLNTEGKFSCKRIEATYATTAVAQTLTNRTNIVKDSDLTSQDDEKEVAHTFHLKCNRDPFGKDWLGEVNVNHQPTAELYRETGRKISYERRGLIVQLNAATWARLASRFGASTPATVDDVANRLYRIFARRQFGIRKYKPSLPWQLHLMVPGNIVRVTHQDLNNFAGGTLEDEAMEVMSMGSFDLGKGTFEVELHETWAGKLISPTGKLSSFNSISNTATLQASDKYSGVATPGDFFSIGDKVRLLDFSAAPRFSVASTVQTVIAKTSTTVQMSGPALGFVPTTNDILVYANYDDADNTALNVQQGLRQRDYAFMGDGNFRLGSGNAVPDTWG